MTEPKIPIVANADNYKVTANYENKVVIGEISHLTENFPEYYRPGDYVLCFFKSGIISGTVNTRELEIIAPAVMFVSVEHLLHLSSISGDIQMECMALNYSICEDLRVNLPFSSLQQLMMHPAASLTQYEMNMALEYLSLIKNVIKWEMAEYKHETLIHLLSSMANMLCNAYQGSFDSHPLNRSEEIAGKFVSLVERNCKKHHDIQWYASQLCLSPKYVANVIKEVTGMTAGDCIDVNIIRQAKALMQIKTLTLQQISDSLGFQNQSHFGTFFHRHTGLRPKAFRLNTFAHS